jgi:hypothetical protein
MQAGDIPLTSCEWQFSQYRYDPNSPYINIPSNCFEIRFAYFVPGPQNNAWYAIINNMYYLRCGNFDVLASTSYQEIIFRQQPGGIDTTNYNIWLAQGDSDCILQVAKLVPRNLH